MLAERAELVAELRLDDKMSAGLSRASRGLSNFSKNVGLSKKNLAALQTNLVRIGAVAAVGLGAAVTSGISSLAELEDANTETAAALKTSGLAAEVSAEQIRAWSNELETASKYAFDDKAIQRAANTLIRFGNVSEENLRAALQVSTDLGVRFGSVEAAASNLARAMADPTKATRALRSAGVSLTKAEQKKIAALVEGGKVAEAQAIILDKLTAKTKGAAAASQGPYRQALASLADATEDAKMALGEAFLPVIEKVAAKLQTVLADPKAVASIREFGQTMARALDSLISIGEQLPWAQIGQSLQLAGAGAKAVLGAFTALPPWIQTAVLTGWGLNKLTGGALTGIVGGLGKGLAQALGGSLFQRGGTPANPLFVADVTGGGGGGPLGKAGKLGGLSATAIAGVAASAAALVGSLVVVQKGIIEPKLQAQAGRNITGTEAIIARGDAQELSRAITGLREMPSKLSPLQKVLYDLNANGVKTHTEGLIAEMQKALNETPAAKNDPTGFRTSLGPTLGPIMERATAKGLTPTYQQLQKTAAANDARARENATKLAELARVTGAGDERIASRFTSLNAAVNRTTAVIASKNFSPRINVPVYVTNNVSVRQTETAVAVHHRYNPIVR